MQYLSNAVKDYSMIGSDNAELLAYHTEWKGDT